MSHCFSVSIKVAKHKVFFTRVTTSCWRERRVAVTVRHLGPGWRLHGGYRAGAGGVAVRRFKPVYFLVTIPRFMPARWGWRERRGAVSVLRLKPSQVVPVRMAGQYCDSSKASTSRMPSHCGASGRAGGRMEDAEPVRRTKQADCW
jgi:hypothetical protein